MKGRGGEREFLRGGGGEGGGGAKWVATVSKTLGFIKALLRMAEGEEHGSSPNNHVLFGGRHKEHKSCPN